LGAPDEMFGVPLPTFCLEKGDIRTRKLVGLPEGAVSTDEVALSGMEVGVLGSSRPPLFTGVPDRV